MSAAQGPLPYISYCDVEVANAARTVEYLRNGLGNTMQGHWELGDGDLCSVLYRLNGGDCVTPDVFTSPAADPAPWYDSTEPGSATFLGVVLLDLDGYDSTITRVVTPRIQGLGGASFSGQRRGPRTWKFRAALISADDAGAEYGLRWLTSVLETSNCDSCSTCDLTVRLVCPPANCSDETLGEWASYDVALVSGPTEMEKWSPSRRSDVLFGCRDFVVVEWTMVAGNPFLYKPPEVCLDAEVIGVDVACTDICDFLFGDPGEAHCCQVAPPTRGTLAPIYTFSSISGMGPILLQGFAQCPGSTEDEPLLEMEITGVGAGQTVIVDCSRRVVEVLTVDPVSSETIITDGASLIDLSESRTLQWIESADCDNVYCFCARTAHPCSQGGDTYVQIDTQIREG